MTKDTSKNAPLLSIIIPVYNAEKTIGRTLESLKNIPPNSSAVSPPKPVQMILRKSRRETFSSTGVVFLFIIISLMRCYRHIPGPIQAHAGPAEVDADHSENEDRHKEEDEDKK